MTRTPRDATPTTGSTRTRTGRAARPISDRYAPRDVVDGRATRSTSPRGVSRSPSGRAGALQPRARTSPITSGAIATPVGTLAPRAGSPRLGAPTGYANNFGKRRGGTFVGSVQPFATRRGSFGRVWSSGWGWNNNWCFNNFGGGGFGWNGYYRPFGFGWASRWSLCGFGFNGFNPWCWNVGVLAPWYAWHSTYWNSCYRSAYWTGWSVPNALPANFWWYPTSTYCPTYLYVPSTVAVVEEAELEPVYDGGEEVIVAGGGVVGSARAGEGSSAGAPAAAEPVSEAMALAQKYVELGDFYFEAGRYDDAAEAYAKARNYLPDDASVHLVLADAVFANGDYHYAAFLVAEAVRLEPGIVTADTDKRTFYPDPTVFEAQVEALQRYCTEKPYDAWAQLLLGYNLRFSDRPTRAVAAFRRVLELDRGNPTARAFLADLVPALKTDAPAEKRDR